MYIAGQIKERIKKIVISKRNIRKKTVDITDLEELVYDTRRIKTVELAGRNESYRHATILKKYAGIEQSRILNLAIEHGVCRYEKNLFIHDMIYHAPLIIRETTRRKYLEEVWKKEVHIIGPYIAYAEPFYTEKRMCQEKEKNGRTLLVFPAHSTAVTQTQFNEDEFIKEIERLKSGFDTVMVCLYYIDVQKGYVKFLENRGYKVVCAGNGNDVLFLSRLRTIIELSDAVMTNDEGSTVSNVVYYNKPCYIYNQNLNIKAEAYHSIHYLPKNEHTKQMIQLFSKDDFILTEEQKQFCNDLYGYDQVKSKEEMREFLLQHSKM